MSHNTGTVQMVVPAYEIGPDSGAPPMSPNLWQRQFAHTPATTGTKFVILHFRNANFPANNRMEVDLGYGTDVFTAADGAEFWTRPINLAALAGGTVPIRYITDGAANGSAEIDRYGRGERMNGTQAPSSLSNSDPFLLDANYVEPIYDPFWFCASPPVWENIACVADGDIRKQVAQSVGMIVTVHDTGVSTCSVTCIGPDLVITAGHCLADPNTEVPTSSVIFNYATNCDGSRPAAYVGKFFKVKGFKKHRNNSSADYAILQLKTPPEGIGIPAIALRPDFPAAGEQVFGIHHPNGAVKKLSRPHPGFTTVSSVTSGFVRVGNLDVSGGSSGSGIFDTSGRYVGTLSHGFSCSLDYFSSASILQDIAATPAPPNDRDVMIVFDRSGSMAASAGGGLGSKIEEARDAASLFVQLVRASGGNRVGLVSFSTSANNPPDFALSPVTPANKTTLIGPSPFSTGIVGGLIPSGMTSIGGGLQVARDQLMTPGVGTNTILLLTDGLQNTPPLIGAISPSLGGIDLHAIGFGSEASLDGTLLSQLAETHNGLYTRAGTGLELKKFFALAFGNIFEAGALNDPAQHLSANQNEAKPLQIPVCGEEWITVVLGWDRPQTMLALRVNTPAGHAVSIADPGIEHATGRTWTFLRIPLPLLGERDGAWTITVLRSGGGGEFPPPALDVDYFINVLANGGPRLRNRTARRRYYTGDTIVPMLSLQYDDDSAPEHGDIALDIERPSRSVGTILTKSQRVAAQLVDGDTIPARFASLMALEAAAGSVLVDYSSQTLTLTNNAIDTDGAFENHNLFGKRLTDLLTVEGNYRFHARARYGHDCEATRELLWSVHVEVGIDPARTEIVTESLGTLADGREKFNVTLTPRDRFGNHLGPGKSEELVFHPLPGSSLIHPIEDKGDGRYGTEIVWDPNSGHAPGVAIEQPGRTPVGIVDPSRMPPQSSNGSLPWWWWLVILLLLLIIVILLLK